jgi:hypothetical protein
MKLDFIILEQVKFSTTISYISFIYFNPIPNNGIKGGVAQADRKHPSQTEILDKNLGTRLKFGQCVSNYPFNPFEGKKYRNYKA